MNGWTGSCHCRVSTPSFKNQTDASVGLRYSKLLQVKEELKNYRSKNVGQRCLFSVLGGLYIVLSLELNTESSLIGESYLLLIFLKCHCHSIASRAVVNDGAIIELV